jgi:hypothetical protein
MFIDTSMSARYVRMESPWWTWSFGRYVDFNLSSDCKLSTERQLNIMSLLVFDRLWRRCAARGECKAKIGDVSTLMNKSLL